MKNFVELLILNENMLFTVKTLFSEYINLLKENNACSEAIYWCEKVDTKGLTFGEAINTFLKDSRANSEWATYNLIDLENYLDDEVKERFIKKISDPTVSFQIFRRSKMLNNKCEEILKEKFTGKLPVAEEQLKNKLIIREKEIGNANNKL
jgi:hypothetical protein